MTRVLVCGGRTYGAPKMCTTEEEFRADQERVRREQERFKLTIDNLHFRRPISAVIEGDAHGADRLAWRWAVANGVPVEKFPANWRRDGRAAGPIRNQQMLDEGRPDIVVAFPGGRGTADMVRRARKAGIPIQHEIFNA